MLFTGMLLTLACTTDETPVTTDDDVVVDETVPGGDTDDVNGDANIVELASDTPELSTLVDAVVAAGLDETLSSDGDFTVFAPTNEAFEALGVDLDTLEPDVLAEILTYHVIAGARVDSGGIPAIADSVADYTLFFDTTDGVMVNNATVIQADVEASNGIVHVVDTVLLPPTIVDAAVYGGLNELVGAVTAADPAVVDLLSSPGDYTVFAPTDDAFADIADVAGTLNENQLRKVLLYHVVPAYAASGDVATGSVPTFLDDQTLDVVVDGGVFVNGAEVVIADVHATNGVVHIVDAVLIPEL